MGELLFFGEALSELFHDEDARVVAEMNGPPEVVMRNYRDLMSGNAVRVDVRAAIHWLRRAVRQEYPQAQYEIAKLYRTGDGVIQSDASYFVYLTMAARGNYSLAQKELGEYYLTTVINYLRNIMPWSGYCAPK